MWCVCCVCVFVCVCVRVNVCVCVSLRVLWHICVHDMNTIMQHAGFRRHLLCDDGVVGVVGGVLACMHICLRVCTRMCECACVDVHMHPRYTCR